MKAPPWFPLWTADFIAGTAGMKPSDVGAYTRLLIFSWMNDGLEDDPEELATLAGGPVSDKVRAKFGKDTVGRLRNARMEDERAKAADKSAKARASVQTRYERSTDVGTNAPTDGLRTPYYHSHSHGPQSELQTHDTRQDHDAPAGAGSVATPPSSPPPAEPPKAKRTTKPAFTPPTVEAVAAYIAANSYPVDPQAWHDHYTSNGWLVGRNPMKDWQAAVRTWAKNRAAQGSLFGGPGGNGKPAPPLLVTGIINPAPPNPYLKESAK